MQFRLKGASGAITGQTFPLDDDTPIGSGEQASVQLDGLLEQHARLVFDGEVLMLEAADQAWVNGEPVNRQALKSGDEIRLGEHRFVLQAPGLRPPSVLRDVQPRRSRAWIGWLVGAGIAGAAAAAVWWYLNSGAPPA
ncbi:FHA domain-containing protein [Wenzhouxiangella marina]|uniref:Uncharacterized protein n=1 Tax=Wenzhouxiangella marina TaxID=1579979 RepID=A0A0K0XYS2_9GAMM|nr:FHA domain-containing protein [Wenzhouxiangella marina]AKS42772.1 hypothetical protein WM2015_2410 [Wenzhouxiangella marina]MBB6087550.1 hypothetical protein [Wenzhouxiangella marina]